MFEIYKRLDLTDEKIDKIILKCYETLKKLDFSDVSYSLGYGYGRISFKTKENAKSFAKVNLNKHYEITRIKSWINIEVNSYECIKFYHFCKNKGIILRKGVIEILCNSAQLEELYEFWTNFLVAIRQYKLLRNKIESNTVSFINVNNKYKYSVENSCGFVREVLEELNKTGLNISSYKNGSGTDYVGVIMDEAAIEFYNFLKNTNASTNINMHSISITPNNERVFLNLDNTWGVRQDENYWTNTLLPIIKSYSLVKRYIKA